VSISAYEVWIALEAGGRVYQTGGDGKSRKRMFLETTRGNKHVIQASTLRPLLDEYIHPVRLPDRIEWIIRLSREIKITRQGAHMFRLSKEY
jgi:hypothetical protein